MASGIFVGLSTVDLIHYIDEFPAANTKAVARSQELFAGGPATNAAIAFSHLGGRATLVSPAGRHVLSEVLSEELARYHVEHIDLAPEWREPPAISSVWVNQRGERSVVSVNATRIDQPTPEVDSLKLAGGAILMVDGHSMAACLAWALAARKQRLTVVMDGGSWKPGMDQLLPHIDIAICSSNFRPPGCSDESKTVSYLQSAGIQQIAITHGPDAIEMWEGPATAKIAVPQVEVVDTTGAGDILHGAFCYLVATGHRFAQALRKASEFASDSCRFHGTRGWMGTGAGPQRPSSPW